jgi:hypothetical protein
MRRQEGNNECLLVEVRKLEDHFEDLEFHHISRDNNMAADVLSKLGAKRALVRAGVFVQDLCRPSIQLLSDTPGNHDVFMAEAEDDWRLNFITYIVEKSVPEDKVKHEKIVRRVAN